MSVQGSASDGPRWSLCGTVLYPVSYSVMRQFQLYAGAASFYNDHVGHKSKSIGDRVLRPAVSRITTVYVR